MTTHSTSPDLHAVRAAGVFNVPVTEVTASMRLYAKNLAYVERYSGDVGAFRRTYAALSSGGRQLAQGSTLVEEGGVVTVEELAALLREAEAMPDPTSPVDATITYPFVGYRKKRNKAQWINESRGRRHAR